MPLCPHSCMFPFVFLFSPWILEQGYVLVTVLPSHLQTPWRGLRCFHPSCLGIMSQCLSHLLCMFAACWDTLLITTEKPQYNLKLVNDNLSLHCLISNNLLMQYFRYTFQGLMSSLRYTFINFLITCPGPAVIRKSAPVPQQQASCQKVLELHSFKQKTGTFVQM